MDLTQGTPQEKNNRAKKMMLWFGIVSLIMGFAGWTSAYIVSSKRKDWLEKHQKKPWLIEGTEAKNTLEKHKSCCLNPSTTRPKQHTSRTN